MASAALTRALQTAERARDAEHQLRALWGMIVYRTYIGNHRKALELTERFPTIAGQKGDRAARVNVDRMAATALRYLGDQADAKRNLDSMLGQYVPPIQGSRIARFQLDQRAAALEAAKGDSLHPDGCDLHHRCDTALGRHYTQNPSAAR